MTPPDLTPLPDADLAELERLTAEATPGPWDNDLETVAGRVWVDSRKHDAYLAEPIFKVRPPRRGDMQQRERDAAFIAAARNTIGRLLAEVRQSRGALVTCGTWRHGAVEKLPHVQTPACANPVPARSPGSNDGAPEGAKESRDG